MNSFQAFRRPIGLLVWLAILLISAGGYAATSREAAGETASPAGTKLTGTGRKGQSPAIARSTSSGEVMVVYNSWSTNKNKKDAYYTVSKDGGATWSTPAPIISGGTPNGDSLSLDVVYEGTRAHAAWVEILEVSPSNYEYQVYYANWNGTSWSAPQGLLSPAAILPINQVVLASTGANKITVLWDQNPGSGPIVKQREGTAGSPNWTFGAATNAFTPSAPLLAMAATSDSSGNLHLVWEQQAISGGSDVFYRKRIGSTWQGSFQLTTAAPLAGQAHQPKLITSASTVYVVMSSRDADKKQEVYLRTCSLSTACTSAGQWTAQKQISGQVVGANAQDPFFVFPNVVMKNGKLIVLYHGIASWQQNQNEMVWWNSEICSSWENSSPQNYTAESYRGINPGVVLIGSNLGVVYEEGESNQIYFMKTTADCRIFLPSVIR